MPEDSQINMHNIQQHYLNLYKQHGDSPMSLGWNKGRQPIRFSMLLSEFRHLQSPSILDIGCGFGDLNSALKECYESYRYVGVDLVEEMIHVAQEKYAHEEHISFQHGNFLETEFDTHFDLVLASGTFFTLLPLGGNAQFIDSAYAKAMDLCTEGVAFDFLSDRVDFTYEDTYHSKPEDILSVALKYTRNVVLKNNYMPFEFCVIAFKDDSFTQSSTVFNHFLEHDGRQFHSDFQDDTPTND